MTDLIEKEYPDIEEVCKRVTKLFFEVRNDVIIKKNREDEDTDISIIVPYKYVSNVLRNLLKTFDLQQVDFENFEEYDNEYIITIDDTYGTIWCEPMLRYNGYLNTYDFATYVLDGCNPEVIQYIKSDFTILAHTLDFDSLSDNKCNCNYDCLYERFIDEL